MTTPGRDDLARALGQLITASGMTAAEVAVRAGVSKSTPSRYINGKVLPKLAVVRQLVEATGLGDTNEAADIRQLAEDLHQGAASRVVLLRPGSATNQRQWTKMLADSQRVDAFHVAAVAGPVQVEAYVRAIFGPGGVAPNENKVEERLAQGKLLDDDAHSFALVMTEGALRVNLGGPAVMAEQLDHLARWARAETAGRVEIGIIPWTTSVERLELTGFDMYDQAKVVIGTGFGTAYLDKPRDVAGYVERFARVRALAGFGEAAAAEFERVGAEYRALLP